MVDFTVQYYANLRIPLTSGNRFSLQRECWLEV